MPSNLDPRLEAILGTTSNAEFRNQKFDYLSEAPGSGDLSLSSSSSLKREDYELDNFDRNLLGSYPSTQDYDQGDAHGRLSLYPRNVFHELRQEPLRRSQLGMFHDQDSFNPYQSQPNLLLNSQLQRSIEGQLARQAPIPEPTGIFHGVTYPNPLQPRYQQVTPPLTLSGFLHTPPGQRAQSSSPFDKSSPTNRLTLRRQNLRVNDLSRDVRDDESIPSQPSMRQILPPPSTVSSACDTPTIQHGIKLVSLTELPDRFRSIFPFQLFNAVQSKCFEALYKGDDNAVVSAPTGSGKTVLLELAICKLLQEDGNTQFKIVYQAPTKSLCSERVRDWSTKFNQLGLNCAELTGDTSAAEMKKVGGARIIVTTPEKWDSITRKWKDYVKLLRMVKLFLIDEVHILKDNRGATLEAVVSRMKFIGASVRFVALSATVPNSQDIATWLGKNHTTGHLPAHRETFGEEFRPVTLQKHVYGFESAQNDFVFDKILDDKLPRLVAKHTHKKPMMIFGFTRKSCENTATKLAGWWAAANESDRAWPAPQQKITVLNRELQLIVNFGVAFHHAGLDSQDRSIVETAFLKDQINVICCTSTLAVGVNLPCHLVIVKGTVGYQDGGIMEYSDLEVMQMLGRAGRPQFDTSAVAIIMTRTTNVDRYEKMISGQEVLESTLHRNLIEHLNSEVGLGTVYDISTAKKWLASTFLSVRIRQNPGYYKLNGDGGSGTQDSDERLERVCERDIRLLQEIGVITTDTNFACTEYGEAMSRYMIQYPTMKMLLSLPDGAKMGQILHVLSQAVEFKDVRMKPQERSWFRELNKSAFIKFPIKETISTFSHKVSLMIQIQLGGVDLPTDKEFNRRQWFVEQNLVLNRAQGLIRCMVDCKAYDCDSITTQNALELRRSVLAGYWENMPNQLRQIPEIGPAAMRRLVQSNINSIEKLAALDTATIERIMSRNPPFGRKVLDHLKHFPQLTLHGEITGQALKSSERPNVHVKVHLGFRNEKTPSWKNSFPSLTFTASLSSGVLVHFWRGNIRKLEMGFEQSFAVELSAPDDSIVCFVACDEIVGTSKSVRLTHTIPVSAFPPLPPKFVVPDRRATKLNDENSGCEYEDDDIQDSDLLAAVKDVEDFTGDHRWDDFVDIEDIDGDEQCPDESEDEPIQQAVPIRMENGRWMCNHSCRGGKVTKSGQTCKHRCCREGLEKPRKVVKKKIAGDKITKKPIVGKNHKTTSSKSDQALSRYDPGKLKLKTNKENHHSDEIEVVDLARDIPRPTYADLGPNEYRKLHKLHSRVQKDEPIRLHKTAPSFQYAEGSQADLSFLHDHGGQVNSQQFNPINKEAGFPDDMPSPSALIANPFNNNDIPQNQEFDDVETKVETPNRGELNGGEIQPGKNEGTPDLTSSFGNDIFDFNAYVTQQSSPNNHLKRRNTDSPMHGITKYRIVGQDSPKDSVGQQRQDPEWLNEVDPAIVAQFAGFVDFI